MFFLCSKTEKAFSYNKKLKYYESNKICIFCYKYASCVPYFETQKSWNWRWVKSYEIETKGNSLDICINPDNLEASRTT